MPNLTKQYRELCEQLLEFIETHPSGWSHRTRLEMDVDRMKGMLQALRETEEMDSVEHLERLSRCHHGMSCTDGGC